jgi:LacI family transcriptional regulator
MHPVYPELLGAISDAAQEAGYDVMLFTTKATSSVEHIIDAVRRKRVDGLVLPAASSRDLMIGSVLERHIPTVLVGHRQRGERLTWVDCDHDVALYQLTRRQLDAGRRRLNLINGPQWVSAYRLRSEGFWRAINEAGPDIIGREIESEMGYADGLRVGSELLAGGVAPDVILCSSDTTAAGVLESLSDAGLRCPDDVAVAGFDDIEFAQHSAPTLTTVRMPLHDTGESAVELLIEMISDPTSTPEPRVLPSRLIARQSDQ